MAEDRADPGESTPYRDLVRELAEELTVKVAFVCEVIGPEREQARTLALSIDGGFLDQMTYKLAGTPCARVCESGVSFLAHDAARMYPEDTLLQEWKIDSYMGVAFFSLDERLLGHVGVMHDGPLENPAQVETRLRSAATSLGRMLQEQAAR